MVGAAVALLSNATVNVTSLPLTAGDWDVSGEVWFAFAGSPSLVSIIGAGITAASATMPTTPSPNTARNQVNNSNLSAQMQVLPLATTRISLAAPTTIYLVATDNFTGGSSSVYGQINARRAR